MPRAGDLWILARDWDLFSANKMADDKYYWLENNFMPHGGAWTLRGFAHCEIPAVLIETLWNCQSELFAASWGAAVTEGGEKQCSNTASHCSTPTIQVAFPLIRKERSTARTEFKIRKEQKPSFKPWFQSQTLNALSCYMLTLLHNLTAGDRRGQTSLRKGEKKKSWRIINWTADRGDAPWFSDTITLKGNGSCWT